MSTTPPKLPDILEKMADVVLAHKPKTTKAKMEKKRKKGKTAQPSRKHS
jgi:hypothetical protein